ncbi:MAG TPA: diguanylate cyclase [Kofleriaceae bacterium]|nr:diguanylate cyclase [Kofleriaceae bacterium]
MSSPAAARAQEISWRTYGRDQGLDNLSVLALLSDSRGALWAATEGGLYRNRGAGFERIGAEHGIADAQLTALHQDSSGGIWVAGASRLYRAAAGEGGDAFAALTLDGADIPSSEGHPLASSADGDVLIASRGHLLRAHRSPTGDDWRVAEFFDAAAIRERPELGAVRAVYSSSGFGTWFGCGTALCQVVAGEAHVWGPAQGVPEDSWEAIFADRQSRLWARGYHHLRVLRAGAQSFAARDIPRQSGVVSPLQGFAEDRDGAVLTRSDRGLARWKDGAWTLFDARNGLPPYGISAIAIDREGLLWLGTRGNGIMRWVGYGEWESWTDRQGLPSTLVWDALRVSPRRLLVANDGAIMALDRDTRTMQAWPSEAAAQRQVNTLARTPDGAIWASSYSGEVTRTDPSGAKSAVATLPISARLFADSAGRVWALTSQGIYRIEWRAGRTGGRGGTGGGSGGGARGRRLGADARGGTGGATLVSDPVLPVEHYTDAAESPDGSLYFISTSGLFRLRGERWQRVAIDDARAQRGLAAIGCSPAGTLWIGAVLSGLLELEVSAGGPTGARARVRAVWSRPAVSSERIVFVRFDPRGWLWVGTDRGVDVYSGKAWRHLTTAEGLLWDDTSEGGFRVDDDDTVWLGTSRGLSHLLRPDGLFDPPRLEVRIDGAALARTPLSITTVNEVAWSRAALTVAFSSPSLRFDSTLRFRYRLRGIDEDWQETAAHSLRYPALAAGDYQFELKVVEPSTGGSSAVASFSLRVLVPWWRTPPFFAAVAFLFLLVVLIGFQVHTRAMRRERRRLERLVAERTRELVTEKRELAEARDALVVRATRDALTGLWNRSAALECLTEEFARAQRNGTPLAVVVADFDHFKAVNDTFGHQAGDAVLREVARRLSAGVRPGDLIGRYGGEELILILPGLGVAAASERLAILHRSVSEAPVAYESLAIPVTLSCGVALHEQGVASPQALVRQADRALYRAKANGRNRIEFARTRSQGHPTSQIIPTSRN